MRRYCTALRRKDPVPSKIRLNNTLLEGGNSFSYLEYPLSFTHDTEPTGTHPSRRGGLREMRRGKENPQGKGLD
jgi:hypothetical protein